MPDQRFIQGKSELVIPGLEGPFDSMVTDPPAGIEFMGKDWDSFKGGSNDRDRFVIALMNVFLPCHWKLRPGSYGLVWALPRTSHWTAIALEDSGFEVRDIITHHFGTGFPKSMDVSKAIDKSAGAKREVIGYGIVRGKTALGIMNDDSWQPRVGPTPLTTPATDDSKRWNGWGTALKPATEHWILVRKPLEGTVVSNVLAHGTGAINIDGCRIEGLKSVPASPRRAPRNAVYGDLSKDPGTGGGFDPNVGRWPSNLLLTHSPDCNGQCAPGCPVALMNDQSGVSTNGTGCVRSKSGSFLEHGGLGEAGDVQVTYGDTGGASRYFKVFDYESDPFFYQSKATVFERNAGLDRKNVHPTVKSIGLMRWLLKLITRPGGHVLDPFSGSGTTGCACALDGYEFIGIEKYPEYVKLARKRLAYWKDRTNGLLEVR